MALKKKQPVTLDMTGEEFKRLIEQRDPNNVVDTLQEIKAMFAGISDSETIADYVRRVAMTADGVKEEDIGIGTAEARDIVAQAISAAEDAHADTEENDAPQA